MRTCDLRQLLTGAQIPGLREHQDLLCVLFGETEERADVPIPPATQEISTL